MTKKGVTSHDVARRAGVSRTTVSMILNRSPTLSFSDETRQRVIDAAAALGYRPNSAARMLVRGDTETIGLVVTDPAILRVDGFVPLLLSGIATASSHHGYRILLEVVETNKPGAYRDLVDSRRIDGLIVLNPQSDDEALVALIESGFPLVLLGSLRHPKEYSVNFSTSHAVQALVDHLVGLGHRDFAHVAFSPPGSVATDARLRACRRALAAHGLMLDDDRVAYGAFSAESGFGATKALLARRLPHATAILAGNDTIALGVLAALDDAGLSVPDDVAVVGFDDLPIAPFMRPALTTVRNPAADQAELATAMLSTLLRGDAIPERRVTVPTTLIVRRSCGAKTRA